MSDKDRIAVRAMSQESVEIVCANCGARYNRLPSFTCPRCAAPLCSSGCEGCTSACAVRKRSAGRSA